ncbi:MAG TPA: tetratricopeptide repeat protein [Gammaproteobacteria bacterium]
MLARAGAVALACALAACGGGRDEGAVRETASAAYVGSETCAGCHAEEARRWAGSHHDLAMQPASPETVLGDFSGVELRHAGGVARFFRRDGRFMVRTDGSDVEVEVTHTFGVEPLQQYLTPLADGRYQALPFAWDSRPAEQGGQRWFHLYPDVPLDHEHPLHWTRPAQTWNTACAFCHSTGLRTGYDPERDTFATQWAGIDVGCEACHGPGSLHAADPAVPLALAATERTWRAAPSAATAALAAGADGAEVEVCAQCHARRTQLTEDYGPGDPSLDHFRPVLLTEDLYHADGRIRAEVFEVGSFLQSRMHRAGVICSDCHEPHGLALRRTGNALCTGCHSAAVFDTPSHHHHAPDASGSFCVDCHMPSETYMVVDERHDHGFRVPRPDLAAKIGAPDACTDCHDDHDAAWAAAAIARWFPDGRSGEPHFGEALHAGRTWGEDRGALLRALANDAAAPGIARATALQHLGEDLDGAALDAIETALRDADPLVQLAALGALSGADADERVELGRRFLDHPLRALRIEAARVLASARNRLSEVRQGDLDRAVEEYLSAQRLHMDRAEGFYNTALLLADLGDLNGAAEALERAIERDPWFAPAYVNLADVYRRLGRDGDGERVLRAGLERLPEEAGLKHALALNLVRAGRHAEAAPLLEEAARLAPDEPLYAYAHALALQSQGDTGAALAALEALAERFPSYRPPLYALATLHRDAGRRDDARRYAERLLRIAPDDAGARALLNELAP